MHNYFYHIISPLQFLPRISITILPCNCKVSVKVKVKYGGKTATMYLTIEEYDEDDDDDDWDDWY
ncbi:MAG: hypothetical protein K6A30_02300 [Lachnospiraceae bacterium]|nr:hypothetical protein [Lachnospiraceae bacterium]